MKQYSVQNLAEIINAQTPKNHRVVFSDVSIDSRTIKKGDCFFAVSGENLDGHDFISQAFDKGAVCAVVDKNANVGCLNDKVILKVDDTIKAIGSFAAEYRRQCRFKVIAITGSVGKTTTRRIIHQVLSRQLRTFNAPKNYNNNIGLPLSLLAAKDDDQIVLAELGTNHPGEIAYLAKIAAPDIAVVTNVHPAHLEGFGSLERIAEEKVSIADGLSSNGCLIINGDSELLVGCCKAKGIRFTSFGQSADCDIQAQKIELNASGSRFIVEDKEVFLSLPGPGNVENALAAFSVCRLLGVGIDNFAEVVKCLSAISMRAEVEQIGHITLINDCYNANPASMKNALEILTAFAGSPKRRLVFICGDMAELGTQSERLHRDLGEDIVRAKVNLLITVGTLSKLSAEVAKNAAGYDLQIKSFPDVNSICNKLEKFIKDYDIVLVKGSRTAKLEAAVEKLKELFVLRS